MYVHNQNMKSVNIFIHESCPKIFELTNNLTVLISTSAVYRNLSIFGVNVTRKG